MTEETKQILEKEGFKFECRGEIDVKGKGLMTTYFIITSPDVNTTTPSTNLHAIVSRTNSIEEHHVLNQINQRRLSIQQKPSIAHVIMNGKPNHIAHSSSNPCKFFE